MLKSRQVSYGYPRRWEIHERRQRPVFVPPCKKCALEEIDIKTAGGIGGKAANTVRIRMQPTSLVWLGDGIFCGFTRFRC